MYQKLCSPALTNTYRILYTVSRRLPLVFLDTFLTGRSSQERFLREAKAAALEHDHIVPILQVGEDRGAPFLVMLFLKGKPLDTRLRQDAKLPIADVLRSGREIARGLGCAHDAGYEVETLLGRGGMVGVAIDSILDMRSCSRTSTELEMRHARRKNAEEAAVGIRLQPPVPGVDLREEYRSSFSGSAHVLGTWSDRMRARGTRTATE